VSSTEHDITLGKVVCIFIDLNLLLD
jgi:hypothetical protein